MLTKTLSRILETLTPVVLSSYLFYFTTVLIVAMLCLPVYIMTESLRKTRDKEFETFKEAFKAQVKHHRDHFPNAVSHQTYLEQKIHYLEGKLKP